MDLRLHATLVNPYTRLSLRALLESSEHLFAVDNPLEQLDYCQVLHSRLLSTLQQPLDEYWYTQGIGLLRRLRRDCSSMLVEHMEQLTDLSEAHLLPGWNRFFLVYIIFAQLVVLLERVQPLPRTAWSCRDLQRDHCMLHTKPYETLAD